MPLLIDPSPQQPVAHFAMLAASSLKLALSCGQLGFCARRGVGTESAFHPLQGRRLNRRFIPWGGEAESAVSP